MKKEKKPHVCSERVLVSYSEEAGLKLFEV